MRCPRSVDHLRPAGAATAGAALLLGEEHAIAGRGLSYTPDVILIAVAGIAVGVWYLWRKRAAWARKGLTDRAIDAPVGSAYGGDLPEGGVAIRRISDRVPNCPKCGTERVGTRPYCPKCGTKWAEGTPNGVLPAARHGGLFGLWRRVAGSTVLIEPTIISEPSRANLLGGTGKFGLEVVGESHYQETLRQAQRRARRTPTGLVIDVVMRPEPTNPYDAAAVRVMSADGAGLLGYLSRERANQYKQVLIQCEEASLEVTCAAVLRGGAGDEPSIGIWLDLAFPARLKSLLKERLNGTQA